MIWAIQPNEIISIHFGNCIKLSSKLTFPKMRDGSDPAFDLPVEVVNKVLSLSISMATLTLTYDSFGPEKVFEILCRVGVVSSLCPMCHVQAKVEYLKDRQMPRILCSCGYRRSCLTGSFFDLHKIEDVPLFMFVLRRFVLCVSVKAISALVGSKEETIAQYLTLIKDNI